MRITLVSFLPFTLYFFIYLIFYIPFASGKCLEDQQSLLLQLKNDYSFGPIDSPDYPNKLRLWNQSIACCSWSGVTCDNEGHVIGLDLSGESITAEIDNSSSLFNLKHLHKLNLAVNDFNPGSPIPSGFSKLKNLTYLNLSCAGFGGQIPIEISQLTRLETLDISSYCEFQGPGLKLENPNLHKLVQTLTNIRQLYLDGVSITSQGQEWGNALLPLQDLQELSMRDCILLGPLDSSLARLENLSVIILDSNNFSSSVPETFSNFKNLTTLSLSNCGLIGQFPQKIFQIGTLSVVDLYYNNNLRGLFPNSLSVSLQSITLSDTQFSGALPRSIGDLRKLFKFDLCNCHFNGTLPKSMSNLTQLSYLDLSKNSFTGPVASSIGNFTQLSYLDLSHNSLTGPMPSFGMAKKLTYLNISENGLSGAIPSSSHFERLRSLSIIDLRYNSISGTIPSSLFTLPLLDEIGLSFNKFSRIEESINVSSSVLHTLHLSNNNLSGPFPKSIFQLSSLYVLTLSDNKFSRTLQLDMFSELNHLTILDLSFNYLTVNANVKNPNMSFPPNLGYLYLQACNLKTFPSFLRNQSSLFSLHISHNQIQGTVPNWIWKLQNLRILDISHNFLTDLEGPLENLTLPFMNYLDLHDNQLHGQIPIFPTNFGFLDFSVNKFSSTIPPGIGNYLSSTIFLSFSNNTLHGTIPDSLCKASYLQVIDLSINNISGTIPSCLVTNIEKLEVLNLEKNNLKGPIPDMFPNSCALKTMDLSGNLLHGPIPKSIANCSKLEVVDFGSNQMAGGFPCFLKNIPTLRVLVLRNNRFQGSIGCPEGNNSWQVIQIMDIALNNFGGKIPTNYFTTWKKMLQEEDHAVSDFIHEDDFGYYRDSVTVTIKGQYLELVKILTIFTTIDFSSNNFEGKIPHELMDFKALYSLNLSNNAFYGEIPLSIENLRQMESLDLSNNSLNGEIPVQLASLSFLSYMNLSFNHLVGKIPTGTQLQSFPSSSYEGNNGLYGPPLTEKPDGKKPVLLPQPTCTRGACSIDWNILSVELGFVFGLGIIIGPLMFCKKWRVWYWKLVEDILCKIFPQLYVHYVTHGGHSYRVLRWWH